MLTPEPAVFLVPSAADSTPIAEAMTTEVVCVRADLEIGALGTLLVERHISGAPVVDQEGYPIGVVSQTDLLRACRTGPVAARTVGDIMMPLAFSLAASASISQAAALMAFEGVHRLVVVSAAGLVVGILSSIDVMRWLARHDGYLVREPLPAPAA